MKRFLALILSVAMLISFVPAVSAGNESVTLSLNIESLLNGFTTTTPFADVMNYTTSDSVFRYLRSSLSASTQALDSAGTETPVANQVEFAGVADSRFFKITGRRYVCLEIDIPSDGIYSMSVHHQRSKRGVKADVYLMDYASFNALGSFGIAKLGDSVGQYDCDNDSSSYADFNGSNKEWVNSEIFADKELAAGKYIITFIPPAGISNSDRYTIGNITLTGTVNGEPEPEPEPEPEVEGITVAYNLSKHLIDGGFAWSTSSPEISEIDYEATNGFYRVVNSSVAKHDGNRFCYGGSDPKFLRVREGSFVCFEINVPQDDKYTLKTNYLKANVGGKVDVYVTPVEEYNAMSSFSIAGLGDAAGSYDCTGASTDLGFAAANKNWVNNATVAKDLVLSKGKYVVTFITNSGDSSKYGSVSSFSLVTGNGKNSVLMNVGAKVTDEDYVVLSGFMSDGSAKTDFSDATIKFESSDETIAKVDDNGYITSLKNGEVTITVKITLDGKEYITECDYVSAAMDSDITIRYDIGGGMYALNAEVGGIAGTASGQKGLTYERSNGFYEYKAASTEGTTGYLNCRIDSVNKSGAIRLLANDTWVAFEIYIPRAGVYDMKMYNSRNDAGTDTDVYVVRSDSWSKENFGTKTGAFTSYDADTAYTSNYFQRMNPEPVDAGKVSVKRPGYYVVTFKAPKASGTAYGCVGSFELVAGENSVVMGVKLKTERNRAMLMAHMSDNELVPFENIDVVYESEKPEVAEINSSTGEITDKASGKVKITATCEYEGKSYSASAFYTALDPNARGIEIKVDVGDALAANEIKNDGKVGYGAMNYDTTNGIYKFFNGTDTKHNSGNLEVREKNIAVRDGRYIAFEVLIPEPGIYTMEMWPSANSDIIPINVFMAKGKVSTDSSDLIGSYDSIDPTIPYNPNYFKNIVKEPLYIENIVIEEPGYYVFNFRGDGSKYANDPSYSNYRRGSVGNFSLYSSKNSLMLGAIPAESEAEVTYISAYPDEKVISYTDPVNKGKTKFNIPVRKLDGTVVETVFDSVDLVSSEESVATVSEEGLVSVTGDGDFSVTATVSLGGKKYSGAVAMNAYDNTGIALSEFIAPEEMYVRGTAKTSLVVTMKSGNVSLVPGNVRINYGYEPEGIVEVDESGFIRALSEGEVKVTATAEYKGGEVTDSVTVKVTLGDVKTEPSYYTYEKRAVIQSNVEKYSWAKTMKNKTVSSAAKYLENWEILYNHLPREGIPRARFASSQEDSNYKYCRYCGGDVAGITTNGGGGWKTNHINRQWKIQCPHCQRNFPSNDFALLYERGLDENGVYDAERARTNNAIAVENGEKDALLNVLYPEVATSEVINLGKGLRPGETVEGWGVDDGWGYRPIDENGKNYKNPENGIEIHAYIPYYVRCLWNEYYTAVNSLATAYVYTGDVKYGRAGAILFDRFADLIKEYDIAIQDAKDGMKLQNSGAGYIREALTDAMQFGDVIIAADMVFPMKDDTQVISYLSKKAEEFGLENDKSSSDKIWDNWKGAALELFEGAKTNRLNSNFGIVQGVIAACAIVVDEEPETTEMVKWIYAPGTNQTATVMGGNVLSKLVHEVDRDGMGNESGDNYNILWPANLLDAARYLENYKGDANYNMWEHPKFVQMFLPFEAKVLANTHHAQIGDSAGVATVGFSGGTADFLEAFRALKDKPTMQDEAKTIAQYIYMREGYNLDALNYGIMDENPGMAKDDLLRYIDETPAPKSDLLAGYGFAVLRDGADWRSAAEATRINNMRDAWIYFGAAASHAHNDNLNLGLEAFGLNIAPDNGYPEKTGTDPVRRQWTNATVSHNTALINEKDVIKNSSNNGFPLHFDDAGQVKLVDVDNKSSYVEAENYRRTLVMMRVDDNISYTVDFFRVTGGDKHTYSFHALAENAIPVSGLSMTEQKDEDGNWIGTYAYTKDRNGNLVEGVNVPYQDTKGNWDNPTTGEPYILSGMDKDPHSSTAWASDNTFFPRGYTWMQKIRRDKSPAQNIVVEFDVEDYRKTIKNTGDIRLRMTQLNTFVPSEVAIVGGLVPRKEENENLPETLDYVLVHNEKKEGEAKLDSLFTTVFEPYKDNRYIESIEACEVSGAEENDTSVRAVKVTHTGGARIDYIIYSEDSGKLVRIDNLFDFKGFVGVYSVNKDGEVLYKYVNDGSVIGDIVDKKEAYEGTVVDFDGETDFGDFENHIDVAMPDEEISDSLLADLAGKWIYIDNDGTENAVYKIVSAEKLSETAIRLNTGNITNIRGYVDPLIPEAGYVYNISEGDTFRIPLSYSDDASPDFDPIENISATAGGSLSVRLNAVSPLDDKSITYVGTAIPRGASLDSETGIMIWKPTSSQIGENHIAVTAVDSDGRQSTIHFTITVYGSTTGNGGGGSSGAPSAPGTSTSTIPATKPEDKPGTTTPTTPSTPSEPSTPATPETDKNVRFIDLGNHSWAADAINALADEGIIKGTSENTFSPAANITRADFAILLVRAFKLASENTENFADVADSDYFAKELAAARNTGLVNGIGENKFAPRNNITRQDMMVIVYRALNSMEKFVGAIHESPANPDFNDVADYARDAVVALINAKLVNGKNGLIDPTANTTRAEVAVLVKRILDFVK